MSATNYLPGERLYKALIGQGSHRVMLARDFKDLDTDQQDWHARIEHELVAPLEHDLSRVRAALGLDANAPLELEAALIWKERDDLRQQVAEMAKELERARVNQSEKCVCGRCIRGQGGACPALAAP